MKTLIIDVREPNEFNAGHVSGAINMPPSEIMAGAKQLANTPKDTQIILYCLSGSRSNVAMNILRGMGYTRLINGINKERVEAALRK